MAQPQTEKCITLRTYLNNYQRLRRIKSTDYLNLHESPQHQKPVSDLSAQISEKLKKLKKIIINDDFSKMRNSIMQYIYDLQGLIDNIVTKLKLLQEKPQPVKVSLNEVESSTSITKFRKGSDQSEMPFKIADNNIKVFEQLVAPEMSRQIKFSTSFTNLCASTTTQDFTPKSQASKKLKSIDDLSQPSSFKLFKTNGKPTIALKKDEPEKEVYENLDGSVKYILTVPKVSN